MCNLCAFQLEGIRERLHWGILESVSVERWTQSAGKVSDTKTEPGWRSRKACFISAIFSTVDLSDLCGCQFRDPSQWWGLTIANRMHYFFHISSYLAASRHPLLYSYLEFEEAWSGALSKWPYLILTMAFRVRFLLSLYRWWNWSSERLSTFSRSHRQQVVDLGLKHACLIHPSISFFLWGFLCIYLC